MHVTSPCAVCFVFSYLWTSVCVCVILCVCVGEEVKVGEIPKPSLPSIFPKKPLPPKTSSSSSSSHPPRRPERPPTLASVHAHTQTHTSYTSPSAHSLTLSYGLPAQVWKPQVWGRGFDTRFCPWQVTWRRWVWLTWASTNEMTMWCLSDSQSVSFLSPYTFKLLIVCFCVSGVCRCGPGRSRRINREAESSDSVAASSHRPPASLADHHTSETLQSDCYDPESYLLVHHHSHDLPVSARLSLTVFPVHDWSGPPCSGGQEGEEQSEGGAGDFLQIHRRFPEKRSSYRLCKTNLTAPPHTVCFIQQRAAQHRFNVEQF